MASTPTLTPELADAFNFIGEHLSFMGCRLSSIQDHLLMVAAVEIARNSKAIGGKTISITTPNPALIYQNDTTGPVFIHIRAKLPTSSTQPRLFLGPSTAMTFNTDAAPYSMEDNDFDTFLVAPGEALYGHITGPDDGTIGQIPVGVSQILDAFRALRRTTGVLI